MPAAPRRRVRVALLAGAALAGVLVGALTYQVSLQPGAALVRAIFEARPLVTLSTDLRASTANVAPPERVALTAPGVPPAHLDISRPTAGSGGTRPMVLWVHGGGFVSSSSATVAEYARVLAAEGFVVGALDYSLAPEDEHPVPVRQAAVALAYLRAHAAGLGGDPRRIVIGGDSAGAQIASETAAAETNPRLGAALGVTRPATAERLRGVVLFCGLYDMRTVGSTGFPALRTYLWAYTGHRDWLAAPHIDRLSTTRQATAAYPPTFLSVGDADPFRTQATELATALRRKGVGVTTLLWTGTGDGLGHEYQFDLTTRQARTALSATVEFVGTVTAP